VVDYQPKVDAVADDGRKRQDPETLQNTVRAALDDAVSYADEVLSPQRAEAERYIHGEPFGDEIEGRSKVVSRDVADTIRTILPSLMRIFFGTDRVVEFAPEGPEDVAMAEQATDYVNYIFTRDNPGFLTLYSAFKDALGKKTGVIKTWWNDVPEVVVENYTGIDDDALMLLHSDDTLTLLDQTSYPDEEGDREAAAQYQAMLAQAAQQGVPQEQLPPPPAPLMLHDVTVRREAPRGRVQVAALPPEEFLTNRGARSIEEAEVVAHRVERTVSDLVAMGYDEEEVRDHLHADSLERNEERLQRHEHDFDGDENLDPSRDKVLYTEAWMHIDTDGDGVSELTKVCCIGDNFTVLHHEPASFIQFADFCPDPEPHRAIGNSLHDAVRDIQLLKSHIIRSVVDSLSQSINPRTGVVEGMVNMDDVLNNEVGGIIRMRQPGMVQPLETPFVGQAAFPMLEYLDRIKEKRTGITDATQGLNADVLQSTTRAAVTATVEAAQQQIELIARIFAETGMRRLYRNILRLVIQHQDKERMVRLRNQWVAMDPRGWNADMDVSVNLVLGAGTHEDRLRSLSAISEKQEGILQILGPGNPLVTLGQYSHTLTKMVELAGFKDADNFFNRLPADFQPPQPPQGEGGDSPEALLAQVQREEIQANIQKKAAELRLREQELSVKLQIERERMERADDRERDRAEADVLLRAAEIQGRHGVPVDVNFILSLMHRPREAPHEGDSVQ
jgi:hypothetical protein